MTYTITKAITTYETYSVNAYNPEDAINIVKKFPEYYLIESDTIEPEYVVVNVEKQ